MESNFNRVVDVLPGLVWTALPDGQTDFVNRRWCEYTGLSVDETCGRGWQSAIHSDDRPHLLERWRSITASREPAELEVRLRRHDGVHRWFALRICLLDEASEGAVRWCGLSTDIDNRKRAEEALRMRDDHYRAMADSIPAQLAVMTSAGEVESANRHILEYIGAPLDDLRGWRTADIVHPDDLPAVTAAWLRAVETAEPYEIEHRIRRADGVYRWFHVRALPLKGAEGGVARWYCLQTDIDDRRRAETLLAGEKQMLEMVARGASLAEILEALCRLVEDATSGCLCSILSIDPGGIRFRHGAGPSLPSAYNALLDGLIMDRNYGPCGMAVDEKAQVIAADVASDPRWAASAWPDLVVGHGLRSCWSTPILSGDDEVIGVFALYRREPGAPTAVEQDLISQFAHLASIAIEHEQSHAALNTSEARKAAILNSALDCIITIDHHGRITEFNPAAERTFGYRRGEVVGAQLADVIIPRSLREQHRQGLAHYLATGESRVIGKRIEMTAMRADGSEFPVELTITAIPLDGPPSFTGYLRDITERKRSEEALRRSAAYLAEAQKLSLTGSFGWRVSTDEHFWSEETFRIFEYDLATPVTLQLILDRVHPQDAPLMRDAIAMAAGGKNLDYECRVLTPGGLKHLHIVAHGFQDQDGGLEYIGAVQDVTLRRASEEALDKARSELAHVTRVMSLGALTASIAHEVNQPLSGIITNANTCLRMLAADPPNVAGARETARRTIRDGNRAADVIKRLRALFAKGDATIEPVDLNDAAREVIALSSSDLQRSRVIVRSELADRLPQITGDRVQLQQVILNLLLNAADAMSGVDDRPRQALLTTEPEDDDRVRLTVRDAGVGIEPQAAERLFDAFYTTKNEGMGIGLSISRSIIENHGGRLWAQANDGPGATFAFSVPCGFEDAAVVHGGHLAAQPAETDPPPMMVNR